MNAVTLDRNNGDSLLMLFTDGPGLAEPLIMRRSGEDYFFHADGLGSVVALTDSDGNVVETYQYAAFGRPTIKDASGNILGQSAVGNPLMFTGTEYDGETGFSHMGYRYLDHDAGRWTQEDPLGFKGGVSNLFEYAYSAPVDFVDPLGLYTEVIISEPWLGNWGRSAFGHVAININGHVYTFGPNGMLSRNADVYLAGQEAFRSSVGLILNVSANQEAAMEGFLKNYQAPYIFPSNECMSPVKQALSLAGVEIGTPVNPADFGMRLIDRGHVKGYASYPANLPIPFYRRVPWEQ